MQCLKISIIILTFNSKKFIGPCLDSIFNQGYSNLEVVIVDNGSKDGTVSFIKENYPGVILIENKENVGACKARNQGIKITQREWILTLDCDIILQKDFLSGLIKAVDNLSLPVGMIQPKILNMDRKTIYSAGIFLTTLRRFYDIGKGKNDNGQFNGSKYIFGACCAATLYKRKMLEEIKEDTGYFDERFFFLVEDVDLAWRAQRRQWKALFYPKTICYHTGNSSHYDKINRQYLCFRNRLFSILKNEKLKGKMKLVPFFFAYDLPRLLLLLFNHRKINLRKEVPSDTFAQPT